MKLIFSLFLKRQSIPFFLLAMFHVDSAFATLPTINNIFSHSSAIHVEIRVKVPGVSLVKWPASSGIGLHKNQVRNVIEQGLKNTANQNIPAQFDVLSRWGERVSANVKSCENSGSIRVVRVRFQTQLNAFEEKIFMLDQSSQANSAPPLATESKQNIIINTDTAEFIINKRKFNLFDHAIGINGQIEMVGQTGVIYITDENGAVFEMADMDDDKVGDLLDQAVLILSNN